MRSRRHAAGRGLVVLALFALIAGPSAAAEPIVVGTPAGDDAAATAAPAAEAATQPAIAALGVAPFEAVAGEGKAVPDVADHLARRLASRGVERVVGPAELAVPARAEPGPEEAAGWARNAGVGAIVVGRTTRLGRSLSIDARVLDGATGAPLGEPLVEETERPEDLGRVIDMLTNQVLAQIGPGAAPVAAVATDGAAAGSEGAPADAGSEAAGGSGGGGISIQADQLEAANKEGAKRLAFVGNVQVDQNGMKVRSHRLDASYPPGRSSPDKFIARGNVRINEGGRLATCDRADFFQDEKKVVCVGEPAILETGCDVVTGAQITFHLDTEVLEVVGGANVKMREGCEEGS